MWTKNEELPANKHEYYSIRKRKPPRDTGLEAGSKVHYGADDTNTQFDAPSGTARQVRGRTDCLYHVGLLPKAASEREETFLTLHCWPRELKIVASDAYSSVS